MKPIRFNNGFNSQFNYHNNFDSFFEGECNQLARHCAYTVATKIREAVFNPFIICGEVGTGKTHLTQAIFAKIAFDFPYMNALYITGEELWTKYVNAIRNKNPQKFFVRIHKVDVLIIDDLQLLFEKSMTMDALTLIVDHFIARKKQIIFTSSIQPAMGLDINTRLYSRLCAGLTVNLHPPSKKVRREALKSALVKTELILSDTIVEYISEVKFSSIRELQGILFALISNASMLKTPIDMKLVDVLLKDKIK